MLLLSFVPIFIIYVYMCLVTLTGTCCSNKITLMAIISYSVFRIYRLFVSNISFRVMLLVSSDIPEVQTYKLNAHSFCHLHFVMQIHLELLRSDISGVQMYKLPKLSIVLSPNQYMS